MIYLKLNQINYTLLDIVTVKLKKLFDAINNNTPRQKK